MHARHIRIRLYAAIMRFHRPVWHLQIFYATHNELIMHGHVLSIKNVCAHAQRNEPAATPAAPAAIIFDGEYRCNGAEEPVTARSF
jgi:hypothetical protein